MLFMLCRVSSETVGINRRFQYPELMDISQEGGSCSDQGEMKQKLAMLSKYTKGNMKMSDNCMIN